MDLENECSCEFHIVPYAAAHSSANHRKPEYMYFEAKRKKVFLNQYVIAQDLKILCRYTAQSDVGSIQKCIYFTAGEVEGGSIISKFPEIERSIDYLISHFSQREHQRGVWV